MSESDLFLTFSIIIIAGVLAGRFAERNKFPRTIPLIITGMIIVAMNVFTKEPILNVEGIHEIVLFIAELALIAILFKEGMHLNIGKVRQYIGTILVIATVGVVIKTFIIGFISIFIFLIIVSIFAPSSPVMLTLPLALLIGAIFTPTDPAATFSILRGGETRIKKKFETILGGESAFNDVFAILLVAVIFIPLVEGELLGKSVDLALHQIILTIIWQFIGGAIIGLGVGLFFLRFINRLQNYLEESF